MLVRYCQAQFQFGYNHERAMRLSLVGELHEVPAAPSFDREWREVGAPDESGGWRLAALTRTTREAFIFPVLCRCGAPIRQAQAEEPDPQLEERMRSLMVVEHNTVHMQALVNVTELRWSS